MSNPVKRFLVLFLLVCMLGMLASCSEPATKRVLLRGDLHLHTKYSHDGVYTMEETAKFSKEAGYDFIAVTDHNTVRQNQDPYKDDELIIIPGMELTMLATVGHANVIGIPDPKRRSGMLHPEEINQYFLEARELGARIQINHPFDDEFGWRKGFDLAYNWIEIWNGKWSERNQKALEWWQSELAKGKKIIATGGTDAHKNKSDRSPFNCVYTVSRQPEDILDAIDKGNLYISISSKGPDIQLVCGNAIMGDTVPFKEGQKIKLKVTGLEPGNIIKIISEKGSESEETASGAEFEKEWPMEDRLFYRVEVWKHDNGQNSMLAFSNPLYIEKVVNAEKAD